MLLNAAAALAAIQRKGLRCGFRLSHCLMVMARHFDHHHPILPACLLQFGYPLGWPLDGLCARRFDNTQTGAAY